jgi:uncharacterized surface protein with fasciclin (FAS1) repeats
MTATRHFLALSLFPLLAAGCDAATERNEAAQGNAAAPAESGKAGRQNLAEALAASPDHSSFMQAVETAGLMETLRGAAPYTIFAPTNAAFAAIPEEARNDLMAPEQRQRLVDLLSYHIVPGTVTAEDLGRAIDRAEGNRAELATVGGGNLSLARDGDSIVVSDGANGRARVTGREQIDSNGIVHSIDAVLMPASE